DTAVRTALPQLDPKPFTDRAAPAGGLAQRVEAYERESVLAELRRQHYHITNTAKALGLERSHLYKKCQQLGIDLRTAKSTGQ
ncbi:MAG TPA: helix-turn-helix domain-containing protein, partial [Terriglobales bacterium]|nr:helix-turn-helix domain-containing protein [Terriglobales bacterium]